MPSSVTPARRRREDDDSEEEDFDVSVDGETPRSSASKRARLDDESEAEDVSDDEAGGILPDSYRRSPKGKEHAASSRPPNGQINGHGSKKHAPGSIVRVTLTNFVTYSKAEFHPGPSLNMIIGPNGTGKSTLVCAICLGLGWAPSHLGRAKDLGEFVKHGTKAAFIEIELAADPARQQQNPVIATKITKDGNKADYAISGKKSSKKNVQELARSFSIQVDNLCQFLPQDRVVDFAALSPVALLPETQRAAAPEYMSEWHEQLKQMRKDQKKQQAEEQAILETLKQMENRQKATEPDVQRIRERTELQSKIEAFEKMKPVVEYKEVVTKYRASRERRKEAEGEFKRLQRNLAPNLRVAEEKGQYVEGMDTYVASRRRMVQRGEDIVTEAHNKITVAEEKIQQCNHELSAESESVRAAKQSVPRLRQNIAQIERARQSPPDEFDPADMNEQVRGMQRRINEIDDRAREIQQELSSLKEQGRQRQQIVEEANREKGNLRSQAGQQANKLKRASPDTSRAWDWIQENRERFQGEVYGPPIVSCTVKDPRHANAVETIVRDGEKLAFTVTSQQDFKTLQQQLYGVMKLSHINIRNVTLPLTAPAFQAPVARDEMQRLGLDAWVLDLIEGPDPVLAMLCDNANIHQTGFAMKEITDGQFSALQRSNVGTWVTPTQSYQISRRREYGDKATSTRVQALRQAQVFTDAPVDLQMEQTLDERIRDAKGDIEELRKACSEFVWEGEGLKQERTTLSNEIKAIQEEKNKKQKALAEYQGLAPKQSRLEDKLRDVEEQVRGSNQRKHAIEDKCDLFYLEKGQLVLDLARAVESLRNFHLQLFEAELTQIEAKSDLEQLRAQHAEEERLLEERRQEVARLQADQQRWLAEGQRLRKLSEEASASFTGAEAELYGQIAEEGWMLDRLQTEIVSTEARLGSLYDGGGGQNTIREYEERARQIEQKRSRYYKMSADLVDLGNKITELRERWEPELDELVEKISAAFGENFAKIQCAGEVVVHKDEDFEQWAIHIKVKFRENEPLSVLDNHRQSGGERAVSTIFYLMSLQSLARAPFRVVDEINQGMDPRNERMVHSRMVDIACEENTSQYFLITPKLLQGLKYHENMKVHCIASGEHMPKDWRELDFGALAKKALAMRGREVVAAG